jgi:glycosyl hydrolase family 123
VTLYRAHYVPVTQSSPVAPNPPGWYADALIPFKHPETGQPLGGRFPAAPFPVNAGQNQPVWVEVFVPPATPPGTYTGAVTVTASGLAPTTVPLTLTVWNFTLPNSSSVRSAFGEFWNVWRDPRRHHRCGGSRHARWDRRDGLHVVE